MARYFILIKRKGAKKPLGVIPARQGISKSVLLKRARQQIKPPLQVVRILSDLELKKSFSKRIVRRKKKVVRRKRKK